MWMHWGEGGREGGREGGYASWHPVWGNVSYMYICIHQTLCSPSSTPSLHDFLQLVRSRYTPQRAAYVPEGAIPKALKNPVASVSGSVVQQHTPCQFDLHLLQEDVVATYLAGKPPVESAAAIRTHFKFRNMAQQCTPHPEE